MSRLLMLSVLLLAPLSLYSCTETPAPASKPAAGTVLTVNKVCPIMDGGEVVEGGGETTWKGMKIGFCCPSCIEEFEKLSDSEKVAALKKNNPEWTLPEGITIDEAAPNPAETPEVPAPAPEVPAPAPEVPAPAPEVPAPAPETPAPAETPASDKAVE
ncbi:MAG: hypothetical protein R3C01_05090 [Planctomycetaceae bacterium]